MKKCFSLTSAGVATGTLARAAKSKISACIIGLLFMAQLPVLAQVTVLAWDGTCYNTQVGGSGSSLIFTKTWNGVDYDVVMEGQINNVFSSTFGHVRKAIPPGFLPNVTFQQGNAATAFLATGLFYPNGGGAPIDVTTMGNCCDGVTGIHLRTDVGAFGANSDYSLNGAFWLTDRANGVYDIRCEWTTSQANPADNWASCGGAILSAPEIAVEQPAGTDLMDGGATIDFTASVGSNSDKTFVIRNTGNENLTGISLSISGSGFSLFGPAPVATLLPNASTSFTVRFSPPSGGVQTGAIVLSSNDADETPFNIALTGTVPPDTVTLIGSDLVFNDGSANADDLTISATGTDLSITHNGGDILTTAIAGSTGADTSSLTIPLASFSGSIILNGLGGDDTLTCDYASGNFPRPIVFNGGGQTSTSNGDTLVLQGGTAFATATYNYLNANDGSIDLAGNALLTYSGLEPITSTITATDVTLNYSGAPETITVSAGPPGATTVNSTAGEITTFTNPSGSLTINAGAGGVDLVNVTGLGSGWTADLNIDTEGGTSDTVTIAGATATGGGDVRLTTDNLTISAALNAGAGRVEIDPSTAGRNIHFGNNTIANNLELSDPEVDLITASVLQVGDATAGRIQFSGTSNGGLITPANVSTVHLITGRFVTDGANNNTGGGIRVANLAIEAGTANGGDDRSIRLNNTNNGVETRIATLAASSSNGWIELRDDNNTGTPTPGIGLTIGTVDGVNGVVNTSNTGDNNRERITINVQQGDVVISNDMSSRRDLLVRALGNQNQIILQSGVTIGHVENGALTLRADNIDLEGTINSPGRVVALMQDDNENQIQVGTGAMDVLNDDSLEVSQAELNNITAGIVQIGRHNYGSTDGSGDITIVGATTLANANNLRLCTNARVLQNAGALITENNLSINARGDVTLNEANVIANNLAIDLRTGAAATSGNITVRNTDAGWNINGTAGVGNFVRTDNGDILINSDGSITIDESTGDNDIELEAATMGIGNGNIVINIGAGTTNGRDFTLNEATSGNVDKTNIACDGNLTVNLLGTGDSRLIINDSAGIVTGGDLSFDVLGSVANARIAIQGGTVITSGGRTDFIVRAVNGLFTTNFDDSNPVTINSMSGTLSVLADRWGVNGNTIINAAGQRMLVSPFATSATIRPGATGDATDGNLRITQGEFNTITASVLQLGDTNLTGNIVVSGDIALNAGQVPTLRLQTDGNISNEPNDHLRAQDLAIAATSGTVSLLDPDTDFDLVAAAGGGTIDLADRDALEVGTVDGITGIDTPNGAIGITAGGAVTMSEEVDTDGSLVNLDPNANALFQTTAFTADIGGTTPGTDHDSFTVDGTVTINPATAFNPVLVSPYTPLLGDDFLLIDNDGADAVSGTFAGVPELHQLLFGGEPYYVTYQGGDGNDVLLRYDLPPVITCPNDVTIECDEDSSSANTGVAMATDDITPTSSIVITENDSVMSGNCPQEMVITRVWTAEDSAGNTSSCTQTVTVVDTTAPNMLCTNITVFLSNDPFGAGTVSITPADIDNGSTDNCSPVTLSIDTNSFDCFDLGPNTVVLTGMDECGNTASCTAIVTVVDPHAPTSRCKDIEIVIRKRGPDAGLINSNGVYVLQPFEVDDGSDDNCTIVSQTVSPNYFTCINDSDQTHTVTLTNTDQSGNVSTCTAQVTIRSEAIILSRPKDIIAHEFKAAEFCIDWCGSTNGLTFQWFKDGTPMPGETNNCITWDCVRQSDEAIYAMEVYNAYGATPACRTADLQLTVTHGELDPLYDLTSTNTDLIVYGQADGDGQAGVFTTSGDVNGDCVDDLVVAWPNADGFGNRIDSGVLAVYFGAPHSAGLRDLAGVAGATPDILITGADAGDQLAKNSCVHTADLTGDGIAEIIVGAWLADGITNSLNEAGEVAILFGRTNWAPNASVDLATDADVLIYGASAADRLSEGGTITTGDINNDGRQDLLVASPNQGAAYLVLGRDQATFASTPTLSMDSDASLVISGASPGSHKSYVRAVRTGDLDADGFDEIVLATRERLLPFTPAAYDGKVFVIRGGATGALPSSVDLSASESDISISGVASGTSYTQLGALELIDLTGDGLDDLIIGTPNADGMADAKPDSGAVLVFNGRAAGSWPSSLDATVDPFDLHVFGVDTEDLLGSAGSIAIGDVDGDGNPDLALSAADAAGPGNVRPESGEIYLLSGAGLAGNIDLAVPTNIDLLVYGARAHDELGRDGTLALPDLDCDGLADIVAGASGSDAGHAPTILRENAGEIIALYGRTAWPRGVIDLANPTNRTDVVVIGEQGDEITRFGAMEIGDLNGDHVPDIVFTASTSDGPVGDARSASGEAHVLYGHVPGPSLTITNLIVGFNDIGIEADAFAANHPTTFWFEYGETPVLGSIMAATPGTGNGFDHFPAAAILSGLLANTTYYIQGVASNECGVLRSDMVVTNTLNSAPIALDNTYESPTNVVFTVDPLSNDDFPIDADGETVTFVGFTNLTGDISLMFLGPLVEVTPGPGFTGNAEFDYSITDGTATSTAHVVLQDTTAPVVNSGTPIVVEATSPAGAVVNYLIGVVDSITANPTLSTSPASGSSFPLGMSVVNVVSTDLAGNTLNTNVPVNVVDTTPPDLILPADITVADAGLPGTMVSFTIGAPDLVDPNPTIVATPASGSTFMIGTTPVNVTATDASGNSVMGSFNVIVTSSIVITQQPQNQTGVVNGSATFQVSATGAPTLTYQWFHNGSPVPGGTGSTLSLSCLTFADAGSYTVVVSNGGGSVTSSPASLTVAPAGPAANPIIDLATDTPLATIFAAAAADSGYGQSVAAGDVNGDGFEDLVMALPRADPMGRTDAGMVGIYLGNTANQSRDFAGIAFAAPDVVIAGARASDYIGRDHGLKLADLDNDGILDLVIGVPFGDGPANSRLSSGEACILFGRTAWAPVLDLDTDSDVVIHGCRAVDGLTLGGAIVTADFNGDGTADLALGASGADGPANSRSSCGEAYILLGRAATSWNTTPVIDLAAPSAADQYIYGAGNVDKLTFGGSMTTGDMDGDGKDDLILSAPYADGPTDARSRAGEVYIVRGQAALPAVVDLATPGVATTIYGVDPSDYLGAGKALATGDVNGDNRADLVIGAVQADGPANARAAGGDAYLVLGATALPATIDLLLNEEDALFYAPDAGDALTMSGALDLDDVNGDGLDDILLGAPRGDGPTNTRRDAGDAYLVYGRSSWPAVMDLLSAADHSVFSADAYDRMGADGGVQLADITGDGLADMIFMAYDGDGTNNARQASGEVVAIYGTTAFAASVSDIALSNDVDRIIVGVDVGDRMGRYGTLAIGDFNMDGVNDLAFGAAGGDGPTGARAASGEIYILAGSAGAANCGGSNLVAPTFNPLSALAGTPIDLLPPGPPETSLDMPDIDALGNLTVCVEAIAGYTYELQCSRDFKTWRTVTEVTADSSGTLPIIDTLAPSDIRCIYRVVVSE